MNIISLAETARYLNELALLSNRTDYSMDIIRAVQYGINHQISDPLCTQVMNLAGLFYIEETEKEIIKIDRTKPLTLDELNEQDRLVSNREARNKAISEGKKHFKGICRTHADTRYVIYNGTNHRCTQCNTRYNIKKPKSQKAMECAA